MREYTDQEICQIIQDYDRIIQELRYVVEAFVRELASLDSNDDWLCRLLALQHSGTGSATTHSSLHDLSDLLKNKKFKGMEYSSELQKGINEKLEEIDGIQKIHRCYMCLPRKEHEPDVFGKTGLNFLSDYIAQIQEIYNPGLTYHVFIAKYAERKSQLEEIYDLIERYQFPMLETVVRNRVSVNSANKARKPLARHRRFDAATKDYEDLTKEVLALME